MQQNRSEKEDAVLKVQHQLTNRLQHVCSACRDDPFTAAKATRPSSLRMIILSLSRSTTLLDIRFVYEVCVLTGKWAESPGMVDSNVVVDVGLLLLSVRNIDAAIATASSFGSIV